MAKSNFSIENDGQNCDFSRTGKMIILKNGEVVLETKGEMCIDPYISIVTDKDLTDYSKLVPMTQEFTATMSINEKELIEFMKASGAINVFLHGNKELLNKTKITDKWPCAFCSKLLEVESNVLSEIMLSKDIRELKKAVSVSQEEINKALYNAYKEICGNSNGCGELWAWRDNIVNKFCNYKIPEETGAKIGDHIEFKTIYFAVKAKEEQDEELIY